MFSAYLLFKYSQNSLAAHALFTPKPVLLGKCAVKVRLFKANQIFIFKIPVLLGKYAVKVCDVCAF